MFVMKKIFLPLAALILMFTLAACGNAQKNNASQISASGKSETSVAHSKSSPNSAEASTANSNPLKILIAYFSWSGNTETIANLIRNQVGGDLFKIERQTPYSSDYNTALDQAKEELRQKTRPPLLNHVSNMDDYDIIFVGYPNWWNDLPMPVFTFLEKYNFSGKTVIPFNTHGGGGLGQGVSHMKSALPGSTFLDAFRVSGSQAGNAESEVVQWLGRIGIKK